MRRRREAVAASAASSFAEREVEEKLGDLEISEEETPTCRVRIRRFAHKIFHHSRSQRVS